MAIECTIEESKPFSFKIPGFDICLWKREDLNFSSYETKCGFKVTFKDPKQNSSIFKFCPFCGKRFKVAY